MNEKSMTTIFIEKEVHAGLKQEAKKLNVPLNQLLPAFIMCLQDQTIKREILTKVFNKC